MGAQNIPALRGVIRSLNLKYLTLPPDSIIIEDESGGYAISPQHAMSDEQKIDCRRCSFFYVTWDKKFPFGCKAMGFKSPVLPSLEVRRASGTGCLRFEPQKRGVNHP